MEGEMVVFLMYRKPTSTIAVLRAAKNEGLVAGLRVEAKSRRGMSLNVGRLGFCEGGARGI